MKILSRAVDVKNIEVNKETGTMKFLVLGVPYGGPDYLEGKDFHTDRFTPETDFGDDFGITKMYATLDHAVSMDENGVPFMHPMKMFIGTAEYKHTDDLGRWYEIELTRGEEYQQVLQQLASKSMLFGSSQAIPTSVTRDAEGNIKSWVVSEVALTTHAANPLAIAEIMKNVHAEKLAEEYEAGLPKKNDVVEESTEEGAPVDESAESTESEGEENVPLADFIEQQFNAEGEEKSASQVQFNALLGKITGIEESLKALYQDFHLMIDVWGDWEDDETLRSSLLNILSTSKATLKNTNDIDKGLRHFSQETAKRMTRDVYEAAQQFKGMSPEERDAEELAAKNQLSTPPARKLQSNLPDYAPGGKR